MSAAPAFEMPSAFKPPEVSVPMSVRVPRSLKADIDQMVEIWEALNKAAAAKAAAAAPPQSKPEPVPEVGISYVVVTMLERQVKEELEQYGGRTEKGSPERAEQIKRAVAALPDSKST